MGRNLKFLPQLILLGAIFLAGCQALVKPANFDERWAYATATVTAVTEATAESARLGHVSKADAQNVLDQTRLALQALDMARAMRDRDPIGADAKLSATLAGLTALQAYLRAQGGKP